MEITKEFYEKMIHYSLKFIRNKELAYDIVHDLLINKIEKINNDNYKAFINIEYKRHFTKIVPTNLEFKKKKRYNEVNYNCKSCNQLLPDSEFYVNITKDGRKNRYYICNDCRKRKKREYMAKYRKRNDIIQKEKMKRKKYYDKNKLIYNEKDRQKYHTKLKHDKDYIDKLYKYSKEYKQKNKEKIQEREKEYRKKWWKLNKKKIYEYQKKRRQKGLYKDNTAKERLKRFQKKQKEELGDWYIKRLLTRHKYKKEDITPELIEAKRAEVKKMREEGNWRTKKTSK